MRVLILLLSAFLSWADPVHAQVPATDIAAPDRAAIQRIISDQIAAFRRDDGEGAFGMASPGIQRLFGDAATFMGMVRGGYQPVYRPRAFEFRELVRLNEQLVQIVAVTGPDGRRVLALYPMEQQPDGSWRIAGCQLLEPDDEAA